MNRKVSDNDRGVVLHVWTYRDQLKHGYHLDADREATNVLRSVVVALAEAGQGYREVALALPPKTVTAGPHLGRRPKGFTRLRLHVIKEHEGRHKGLEIVEDGDTLLFHMTVDQLSEFRNALDAYLQDAWDFNYGALWFWPYIRTQREED